MTVEKDSACHTATILALKTAMRKDEIRLLRWEQVDLEKRTLTVGHSKTEAGAGRLITLNPPAFEALLVCMAALLSLLAECHLFR